MTDLDQLIATALDLAAMAPEISGATWRADLDTFDICALCPVVQDAGGIVTDLNRGPLFLTSNGAIVASASSRLHSRILAGLCG
ncbi:Inositol monophosphatase family protein [Falsiruegeria litorea R37]|uniref:Inositol monophosphatase family protein n=1 Tax=Falsiruegeria litorea R37 TaxID=1200284 RepID=A0A1Y5TY36_9RHOB|nr:inositol monophosphatase family protein [Falsiruegeria litorea]SLN73624.1 Inositol monophosphatase family protein [Falsiruegeria litorea R37]